FLKDMNVSPDKLELLAQSNVQFLLEGYTVVKPKSKALENPLFEFVLFIERGELKDLIDELEPLVVEDKPCKEAREELVDAYLDILTATLGEIENEKKIKKMSLGEINKLVSGLPSTSEFNKYSLLDIEKRWDCDQVYNFIESIKTKIKALKRYSRDSKNDCKIGRDIYFWVPQNLLP
ncbi:MAG: hypothetical protein AAFV80_23330, partial [Bacteroidota bacterium]